MNLKFNFFDRSYDAPLEGYVLEGTNGETGLFVEGEWISEMNEGMFMPPKPPYTIPTEVNKNFQILLADYEIINDQCGRYRGLTDLAYFNKNIALQDAQKRFIARSKELGGVRVKGRNANPVYKVDQYHISGRDYFARFVYEGRRGLWLQAKAPSQEHQLMLAYVAGLI